MEKNNQLVEEFLNHNLLLSPEIFQTSEIASSQLAPELIKDKDFLILNQDNFNLIKKRLSVDWLKFDSLRTKFEKKGLKDYSLFLETFKENFNFEIIKSFSYLPQKIKVDDFAHTFLFRYHHLEKILKNKAECQNPVSIKYLPEGQKVSLIGLVKEKEWTKTNNLSLVLEDPTGEIRILLYKEKIDPSLLQEICEDEIIGLTGIYKNKQFNAENIFWPEFPSTEIKKSDFDINIAFLSDLHVGSNLFLEEEFNKFLDWINGRLGGDQQKELAKKIKFLFITGDLVDGVGIYPEQEKELIIKDIYQQYKECADLLRKIPPQIRIIICPGNHDITYLAEPQPPFLEEFTKPLRELPNITLVSNPSLVNICSQGNFPGYDLLLYHGSSYDYYIQNFDFIRKKGGYQRIDLVMKFLLKKRHLSPTFSAVPYSPTFNLDPLLIYKKPDFLISGHIHYSLVTNYRGTTLISSSCWQDKTSYQEKLGHQPEPARVPVVNLKTRQVKILKFI